MEEKFNRFKELAAEIADIFLAASVLEWDLEVNMPPGGTEQRGNKIATLQRLVHTKTISPEFSSLMEEMAKYAEELDPDSDDARMIKETRRWYDDRTKVPPEFTAEFYKTITVAFSAWEKARKNDDFKAFQPHLEKVFELRRQYAEFFAPYEHIYDPLLNHYEPGMKTAEVQAIFNELRPQQVELLEAIAEQPQVDDSFLHLEYDEQKQWDFGVEIITQYGFDWERGRQDKSSHPFTVGFSVNDVRITTRVDRNFLPNALFCTLHECGHGLYGMGINPAFERTTLADGASLAVHESQSRTYENLIGRSLPFWEYYFPRLKELFPSQLGNVDLQTFYKGINKVEPSLIRVEADEATYNLHIMLRLELEIALLDGSLAVKDLPEAWNARMEEYFGITPPNDAQGVLQDVHWSNGYIGYFSTYALGNLIAAQLWDKLIIDIPDVNDQFRQGEFMALTEWMKQKIHVHGKKYEPQELVEKVTGSKIDPVPYMKYLTTKYGEIYGL